MFSKLLPFHRYPKDESLNIKDFAFNVFTEKVDARGTTSRKGANFRIPWQSSSQDSTFMTKDPSTVPGWRTVPKHRVHPRKKKKDASFS